MSLLKEDFSTLTWTRFKAQITARLSDLRSSNDGDKSPEHTAKLRGRIAELKNLLALDIPAPAPVPDDH